MMMAMSERAGRWRWGFWLHLALASSIGLAAYLGLLPAVGLLRWPYADKVMHFLLIGGISFWIVGGWGDRRMSLGRLRLPLAVAAPMVVAAAEECMQVLSPRRNADLADFAADAAGLLVFWLLGRHLFPGGLLPTSPVGGPKKN